MSSPWKRRKTDHKTYLVVNRNSLFKLFLITSRLKISRLIFLPHLPPAYLCQKNQHTKIKITLNSILKTRSKWLNSFLFQTDCFSVLFQNIAWRNMFFWNIFILLFVCLISTYIAKLTSFSFFHFPFYHYSKLLATKLTPVAQKLEKKEEN